MAQQFSRSHSDDTRAAIGLGVARRADARRRAQLALAAAVDLLADEIIGERAHRMALRMLRKIRRSSKRLTKNQVVGPCSGFDNPHPARVFDALVARGEILITDTGQCVLPERDR